MLGNRNADEVMTRRDVRLPTGAEITNGLKMCTRSKLKRNWELERQSYLSFFPKVKDQICGIY